MDLHFFKWMQSDILLSPPHGPTMLVFLHGMGGTGQIWRPISAGLEEEFLCIAPDQRGHGSSRPVPDSEKNKFHATDYAADLIPLLEKVSKEFSPSRFFIIGHSMGVRSGLATANSIINTNTLRDIFKGFIAVDIALQNKWGGGIGVPLANFIQSLPETFADRATMREHLFTHCPDPGIAQYLSAVAKKISDAPELWSFPFDHEALIQTILQAEDAPIEKWVHELCEAGIPVLALRGMNSNVWLKDDYERARITLAHPLLTFEEWENCGHGLPFEQRARFIERIRTFVMD